MAELEQHGDLGGPELRLGGEQLLTVDVYNEFRNRAPDLCPAPMVSAVCRMLDDAYGKCAEQRSELTEFTLRFEPWHMPRSTPTGLPTWQPVLRLRLDAVARRRAGLSLVELFRVVAEALHAHRKRMAREGGDDGGDGGGDGGG